ncbi:MAG: amidase [Rhizobiaceae bacterium]|nr:amidase [Rhizobiaceae bacterium]
MLRMPDRETLKALARSAGIPVREADWAGMEEVMADYIKAYGRVESLADPLPVPVPPQASRTWRAPLPEENAQNAWLVRSEIRLRDDGPLAGMRVAVKDNTMVAGLPMHGGSTTLEGYVPEVDATVVARLLESGAIVTGKVQCEHFSLSGGSHTSSFGPVHNPWRHGYSCGGSSSGSAAVVAAGEADIAIGADQGGSIRVPASFCGIVGLKPSYGLVPYSGMMPIEPFVDHAGPMTRNVADNARALQVMAGPDGMDGRQPGREPADYLSDLGQGLDGLTIGVLAEGFGRQESEPAVDAAVHAAIGRMEHLGARIVTISIPEHDLAPAIWAPIGIEGVTQSMMLGDGYGQGRDDLYMNSLMAAHRGWRSRAEELSAPLRMAMLLGLHARNEQGPAAYGKAVNLARWLRGCYDRAFEGCDLIAMPTTPLRATPLPPPDADIVLYCNRAAEMLGNVTSFNLTHHPALSLPVALIDGLPVGLQLVGRMWEEATIYRAAHALEQSRDWKTVQDAG